MSSDLLHTALARATLEAYAHAETGSNLRGRNLNSPPRPSNPSLEDAAIVFGSAKDAEPKNEEREDPNELIQVLTPISTPFATPSVSRNTSRSSSPTRKSGKGAGKPRRDKAAELAKSEANRRTSIDPLVRLENNISSRIFAELGVDDLVTCSMICRKWRSSQTINYTWYNLLQSLTYVDPTEVIGNSPLPHTQAAFLLWTRRDSKIDWRARFASIYAPPEVIEGADLVDDEGMTMKEEREEKWRLENEQAEYGSNDKAAMRDYYKNLGNSKVKGKSGKGSAQTWTSDYAD